MFLTYLLIDVGVPKIYWKSDSAFKVFEPVASGLSSLSENYDSFVNATFMVAFLTRFRRHKACDYIEFEVLGQTLSS